jgi:peptidoglycan/LPS O-acetylase OafA/YrhL
MNPDTATHDQRVASCPPWGTGGQFAINLFLPIRLTLALLVIFSHSFPLSRGNNDTEPLMWLIGEMTIGDVSVGLFLAVSGFLVTRSWETSSTTQAFLLKRVLRVFPGFCALMALQAFVLAPLASRSPFVGYSWRQLGLLAFEVVDLVGYGFPYGGLLTPFPDNPLPFEMNGSLWTVRYEFLCYLLIAVAWRVFRRRAWLLAAAFATVLTILATGWLPPWHWVLTAAFGDITPWPRLLAYFLAGALFYRLRGRIPHDPRLALLAAVMLATVAATWSPGLKIAMPIGGVYLLFWVAYHPRLVLLPGLDLGDLSYGTYLYGFPIQQSVMMWISPVWSMDPYRLAAISAGLSLVAGAISWHAVEKPFLTLKPRGRPDPSSPTKSDRYVQA